MTQINTAVDQKEIAQLAAAAVRRTKLYSQREATPAATYAVQYENIT